MQSVWEVSDIFLFFVPITQQLTELLTAHNSFWYNTDTNDYLLFLMCMTYNVCLTVSLLKRALAMLVWVWFLFFFFLKNIFIWCAFSDVTNKMFFDKQSALSSHLLSWRWMFHVNEYACLCRCIPAPQNNAPAALASFYMQHLYLFNKATQLRKKKNNTADALFICDWSHIVEHVQKWFKNEHT